VLHPACVGLFHGFSVCARPAGSAGGAFVLGGELAQKLFEVLGLAEVLVD
jgi:hypothetical protein